jgi:hypothetical protein
MRLPWTLGITWIYNIQRKRTPTWASFYVSCLGWSSIQSVAHLPISSNSGLSARPLSVIEYSMRTGISGYTSRRISPSISSSFNRSDNTLPLMLGNALSISLNRNGPFNSWKTIKATHLLLNSSIAFSNSGHICVGFTTITPSICFIVYIRHEIKTTLHIIIK